MCMFSAPSPPPPVQVPAAPPVPDASDATNVAQESDPQVQQARADDRARRLRGAASNTTLVTGGAGLVDNPSTGLKTAFGQ